MKKELVIALVIADVFFSLLTAVISLERQVLFLTIQAMEHLISPIQPNPELPTILLLGTSLLGLAGYAYRRKHIS